MAPTYFREEITFGRGGRPQRLFMAADEMRMPKTRDLDLWRAYIEDGNREFCNHERTILKKYVRRITGCHKKMLFPERFRQDRTMNIDLWIQYIEARQTPAEAAERFCSLANYKGRNSAIRLEIARNKLFAEIEASPAKLENIWQRRQADDFVKNFDFSSGRLPRGRLPKDKPLQGPWRPKRYATTETAHNRLKAAEHTPIAPQFSFNIAIVREPASFLLRNDPHVGKYMVKLGRESPLRQSISLNQVVKAEDEGLEIDTQVICTVDALKGQISGFETKNLIQRTRYPVPNIRRPRRTRLNGL